MTTTTTTTPAKTAKDQIDLVTPAQIRTDYDIAQNPAMGSEVEYLVVNNQSHLIHVDEHDTLKAALGDAGIPVSDEPLASIFEVKTGAHRAAAPMIAEMGDLHRQFTACIRSNGYHTAQLGYLGHLTLDEAMTHRIPSERADGLLEHFIQNGQEMCARQPLMTTSVHLSISYADADHLYEMGKLLMVLTPSLTTLCENTGGVFDGQNVAFNPSAKIRLSQMDQRGGLSPVISAATSAEDLMTRQAEHIFTTPMMMHLDEAGQMQVTDPAGRHPTLQDLEERGLNTRSNALLSESMQYHMLKITSLRDAFGRMCGKRLEIRMADNGPFQHDFMATLGEAMGFNAAFRADLTQALLKSGIDAYAQQTAQDANAALHSIAHHRMNAMNAPLGNATVGQVTGILLDTLAAHNGEPDALKQALHILNHGPQNVPVIRAQTLGMNPKLGL